MIRDIIEILERHFNEAYQYERKCLEEDIFMFYTPYDIIATKPKKEQLRNCILEIIGRIKGIDAKKLHREPTYNEAFDWCRRNFPLDNPKEQVGYIECGALALIEWIKGL